MNIYDRGSEAFKNYIPLPDAEKAWKKNMKMVAVMLIGVSLILGSIIASPEFLISYRGSLFLTAFVIVLSIFGVPVLIYQSRFLTDTQLCHDFMFVMYNKSPSARITANNLLAMASLDILMGNAENARFAYDLTDASCFKPKSMPVYEKVKAYVENGDSHSAEIYSMKDLMPGLYRRFKCSKFIAIFIVFCNILLVAGIVYLSAFYL